MKVTKTLRVRVRDKHAPLLKQMARQVNFVWNYLNELSQRSIKERRVFLSEYDLHPYTKGAGKELGLHSQTLQVIAGEYVTRRKQFKKSRLNWRKSSGSRRSLGWVPVNTGAACWKNGQVYHNGHFFKVWDSYDLANYRFRTGSFSEDARGRFASAREEVNEHINTGYMWRVEHATHETFQSADVATDHAVLGSGSQLFGDQLARFHQLAINIVHRTRSRV
jgi:hypothetical protein